MSIARDMKKYTVQKKVKNGKAPSGAPRYEWLDGGEIDVAVYKNSEVIISASERYKESTHTGLTYSRDIKAGWKLKRGDCIYQVMSCDTGPRLTNLILKELTTDV